MTRDGYNQLPVVDAGQIQGMLTREDVITFLQKLQTNQMQHKPVF
jgi:signal-transduction protein with cAMP-binding, CBS, and nucleotidyltransferase domain